MKKKASLRDRNAWAKYQIYLPRWAHDAVAAIGEEMGIEGESTACRYIILDWLRMWKEDKRKKRQTCLSSATIQGYKIRVTELLSQRGKSALIVS